MIIELPESFHLDEPNAYFYAYVENGTLFIKNKAGHRTFRNLMFNVTYASKGKHKCLLHCGKNIINNKATLDHLFPQDLGGVSITNNLLPACQECNSRKSNLNYEQFVIYESLTSQKEKSNYMKSIKLEHSKIKYESGFYLPKDWISLVDIHAIQKSSYCEKESSEKIYEKTKDFYLQYSNFRKPVILDKNLYLLDEYEIYLYALNSNITIVPAIILENVETIF